MLRALATLLAVVLTTGGAGDAAAQSAQDAWVERTRAQVVAAAAAPDFAAARDRWLADDEQGLGELAAVIDGGNDAATLLFTMILRNGHAVGEVTFPANGFYREDLQKRSAFFRLFKPVTPEDHVALAQAGEPRRAMQAATDPLGGRQAKAALALLLDLPGLDPDLRLFGVIRDTASVQDAVRAVAAICAEDGAAGGFAPLLLLCGQTDAAGVGSPAMDDLAAWLAEDGRTAPYRRICTAVCVVADPPCLSALYWAVGGFTAFISLRSPTETLIPQPDFVASERAVGILWRMARAETGTTAHRAQLIRRQVPGAACLADALGTGGTRWDIKEKT